MEKLLQNHSLLVIYLTLVYKLAALSLVTPVSWTNMVLHLQQLNRFWKMAMMLYSVLYSGLSLLAVLAQCCIALPIRSMQCGDIKPNGFYILVGQQHG